MFDWAYNFSIKLIIKLLFLLKHFYPKIKKFLEGRENLRQDLQKAFEHNSSPVIWVHCASLGEFEQGRPLIERIKKDLPDYKIILTFFSPSGYEIRKNYALADWVFYLPFDTQEDTQHFIKTVKPRIGLIVKYEFWRNLLCAAYLNHCELISVSAIFRLEQIYFKPYGKWSVEALRYFSHFFVQDIDSQKLLASIGLTKTSVAGDTRFDRVKEIAEQKKEILIAEQFKNQQLTLVAGSIWSEDIEVLANFYNHYKTPPKLIVAPHTIEEENLKSIEKTFANKKIIRFSQAHQKLLQEFDILIIDNIGMLSALYRYGEIAYIGGAFRTGLHNILEAAVYGIPVFFGNDYHKFSEAVELARHGGAFACLDATDFTRRFTPLLENANLRKAAGKISDDFVNSKIGATDLIMKYLQKKLRK